MTMTPPASPATTSDQLPHVVYELAVQAHAAREAYFSSVYDGLERKERKEIQLAYRRANDSLSDVLVAEGFTTECGLLLHRDGFPSCCIALSEGGDINDVVLITRVVTIS